MAHATDDSAISTALEQIIENGFDRLDTAVSTLINEAMRIERSRVPEAEPCTLQCIQVCGDTETGKIYIKMTGVSFWAAQNQL
jgi:hypothetical protein